MLVNIDNLRNINTPAGYYWTLFIGVTSTETYGYETPYPISFLPTGKIDAIHTLPEILRNVTLILEPTIMLMQHISGDPAFNIWKLLNFVFVSYYWLLLRDLGEIAPTAYNFSISDSPQTTIFPSTNNVFINETLFHIYSEYILNTIIPLFNNFFGVTSGSDSFRSTTQLVSSHSRQRSYETTLAARGRSSIGSI
jgi:hypothetical protein